MITNDHTSWEEATEAIRAAAKSSYRRNHATAPVVVVADQGNRPTVDMPSRHYDVMVPDSDDCTCRS